MLFLMLGCVDLLGSGFASVCSSACSIYVSRASQLGKLLSYRYWDPAEKKLDFEGLCTDLRAVPNGSVVLLHACVRATVLKTKQ